MSDRHARPGASREDDPPDPAQVKRALARLARAAGPDPPDATPAGTVVPTPDGDTTLDGDTTPDGDARREGASGADADDEPGGHEPRERLLARADTAVSDLTLAAEFVEEGGLAALRRACGREGDGSEGVDPDRLGRGRAALAAFDDYRRAARADHGAEVS